MKNIRLFPSNFNEVKCALSLLEDVNAQKTPEVMFVIEEDSVSQAVLLCHLESYLARYLHAKYVVACESGRSAIRYALLALGIGGRRYKKDEVIVPDFLCEIVPLTIWCVGALPKFCDVGSKNLGLSETKLKKRITPLTKAVIFAHIYGIPVDPDPILEIAQDNGLIVIEDAAQAFGAEAKGVRAGTLGDCGILSFSKLLDVGLGGAVATNNEALANKVRTVRDAIAKNHSSWVLRMGYRIADVNPGLLCTRVFKLEQEYQKFKNKIFSKSFQRDSSKWFMTRRLTFEDLRNRWRSNSLDNSLVNKIMEYDAPYNAIRPLEDVEIKKISFELKKVESIITLRRRVANMFEKCFLDSGIKTFDISEEYKPSYMKYPIILREEKSKPEVLKALRNSGVRIEYDYKPCHISPFFSAYEKGEAYPNSESFSRRLIPLPIKESFKRSTVEGIVSTVTNIISR
jgi:dTDP-4-amino-4,6-dideoxygalactose transaminase